MKNTKTTKRALLSSVVALLLCFTMLLGTTFAWFTDSATSGRNVIQSGNLDVVLEYKTDWNDDWKTVDKDTKIFKDGATYEPGYTEVVFLRVSNAGSLALKYNLNVNVYGETTSTNVYDEGFSLKDYLEVGYYVQDEYSSGVNYADILIPTMFGTRESALKNVTTNKLSVDTGVIRADSPVLAGTDTAQVVAIVLTMPETVGNEANYKTGTNAPTIQLGVSLLATQHTDEEDSFGNDYDKNAEYAVAETVDTWDGTVDISWYTSDPDATEFTLSTAEQFAGLAALVEGTATHPVNAEVTIPGALTFDNVTFYLDSDIDLGAKDENGDTICFDPIGSYRNEQAFKGIFDGQGHTISNLSQNTWALDNGYYYSDLGLGLFGMVEDATIKNLIIDGANISGESAIVGLVAATAFGDCTFENIIVRNSSAADYQYYAGGIVGWASGNHIYKNINMESTTTIGSQWGDFGNASGGIIGGTGSSATIYMKDCDVACRIDAVNDVVSAYQWYAYRNCGMLIGRTNHTATDEAVTKAAAPNLTCENVTVTYGEWANYTYCEFAGTGYPYVRVQSGTSVDAYSNVRYGHPTDANGNTVVDDNHVHNDGEEHHLLIAFDQLYGGPADQRSCTYGVATHEGVTVIYNNK